MNEPLILKISADFAAAREAQERIVNYAIRLGFGPQHQFAIKLAFQEAIIKATKKDKFGTKKEIYIEAQVSDGKFESLLRQMLNGLSLSLIFRNPVFTASQI
jgi:hypothetical protein